MRNAHFKLLMWMAAILLVVGAFNAIAGQRPIDRGCGTFDIARLEADIKSGFFNEDIELAKAVLAQLAWQLKCERSDRAHIPFAMLTPNS